MAENNNRLQDEGTLAEEGRGRARAKRGTDRFQKGSRFSLNLFDLIVIFVVLVAVVLFAAGVRLPDLFGDSEQSDPVSITYTLTFANVSEKFASSIQAGETLRDADTDVELGTVLGDPVVVPHKMAALQQPTEEGAEASVVMKEVPGRVDITITVQAQAVYATGVGYSVSGKPVRAGASYHARFLNFVGAGVCGSLDESPESEGRDFPE